MGNGGLNVRDGVEQLLTRGHRDEDKVSLWKSDVLDADRLGENLLLLLVYNKGSLCDRCDDRAHREVAAVGARVTAYEPHTDATVAR